MTTTDELRAALAVAELEEQLVAAKETAADPSDYEALADQLREARRAHRELRSATAEEPGDAVVAPDAIATTAEVQQ